MTATERKKPTLVKFEKDELGIIPMKGQTNIPSQTPCQEASTLSGMRYIPCGAPAVAIVNNGDQRPYFMCRECTYHNLRNRGARLLFPAKLD